MIALRASIGGIEALREVLAALPANSPGVVVVQHTPERFTTSFAERLDSLCRVRVRKAVDVLFDSCARFLGPNAVGALLTGIGAEGEQSAGIDQVNRSVAQMDTVTQSNASQTAELSATAERPASPSTTASTG